MEKLEKLIGNDWDELLEEEFQKDYYKKMESFLVEEYKEKTIFPEKDDIFAALKTTPYRDVKVVILGQDPYHGKGQSHGLAFSVKKGIKIPPSLRNIYKELKTDLDTPIPDNGYLEKWARQGVLLLNTSLTVREGEANSHREIGWQIFTDRIIELLNQRDEPIVFILWGASARRFKKLIDLHKHATIEAPHPSPLSAYRGFFGSKPFSQANQQLIAWGREPLDWEVT